MKAYRKSLDLRHILDEVLGWPVVVEGVTIEWVLIEVFL